MTDSSFPFDEKNFEVLWHSLDKKKKSDLVVQAANLVPSLGIFPVIPAILSYHFSLRICGRKSLDIIKTRVRGMLNNPINEKMYVQGLKESAKISARIYQHITPQMPLNDAIFMSKTLLEFGDNGAYFAFKLLANSIVSIDTVQKAVYMVTESQRLSFIDQYIQSPPEIRLKYATVFKKITCNIITREPVIDFFAILFDRKRNADPFLNNIPFCLRDPDTILKNEVQDRSPTIKITGLKALAMMKNKLPGDLLREILTTEHVKKVRETVYSLVENSSMGLYPELFDPIFSLFLRSGKAEAINAFKALVVTGKRPVYALINQVRETYPDLMPVIHREIASFSRISFFVIQDIALNKSKYLDTNYDINLACVLGMVRKRPERMVWIMEAHADISTRQQKEDVVGLIEKTRTLLKKENQDIASWSRAVSEKVNQSTEKHKKFFSILFPDPIKKKLERVRKNIPRQIIDFQDEVIGNEDLSDLRFAASVLNCNGATFKNCNLTGSHIEKAYFKEAVFYDVDMSGAMIRNGCFDQATLINVNARKTRFVNCSFQGARLYNCNFNHADLHDAVFVDALVSKTAFNHTDLSCAVFSHARLSGVSFATACLDLADFSHAQARFSRFPPYAGSVIRSQEIVYNARKYQISFNDLPSMDNAIVTKINLLIFCEFIHYGEIKFLHQNKLSLLTAFDIFKPSQADFFQVIPLLLHENFDVPNTGHVHPETPCGIAQYLPPKTALHVLEKFIGRHKYKARQSITPYIEGIFTMGSVGSLAQTHESDIDYWICINEETMSPHEQSLLRQKLDFLEKMALTKFQIQITFFVVDIQKARNNDFGGSTQESSGSAQSRLLKEEFYRTMIHVAGKLPLWSVLPTSISLNYYHMIFTMISKIAGYNRYMDLGDIHAIPVNEFFGASIWQMFKWLKSPFKSVIKMALLEKYIHSYGKESLLCNQYKNVWMNSGAHLKLAQNDSYIILVNNLLAYYRSAGDIQSINLLLTCLFLKLGISKESVLNNTVFGMRKHLVIDSVSRWGWTMNRFFEIGRFKEWHYQRIHRLSASIERYMFMKYNEVKKIFENRSRELMISNLDRQVLERKVDIVFKDKPFKIKKILLVSRSDRLFSRLHIRYLPEIDITTKWELFHTSVSTHQNHEESLLQTRTIEEIGAWLINNSLFTEYTDVSLVPNATPVTHEDIQKLFCAMYAFFIPQLNRTVQFNELKKKYSALTRLFVSFNFYSPGQRSEIKDYCVIYLNSWGEMFHLKSEPDKTFSLDSAKKNILGLLEIQDFPEKTLFYFSRSMGSV